MAKSTLTLSSHEMRTEPLHHIEDRLNHVRSCLGGVIELIDRWIGDGGNQVPDTGVIMLIRDGLEEKTALLQELADLAFAVRCGKAVA